MSKPLHNDPAVATFKADKRYLLFPCSRGLSGKNRVFIDVDGRPYTSAFDALIAAKNPDHWRWIDLKLMQGKTVKGTAVTVNNLGGGGVPGLEETWDRILSSGKMLYGTAVDDAHYFKRPEDPAAFPHRARPPMRIEVADADSNSLQGDPHPPVGPFRCGCRGRPLTEPPAGQARIAAPSISDWG